MRKDVRPNLRGGMKRSTGIVVGVAIGIALCLSCCAAVYGGLFAFMIVDEKVGIFPEVSSETTPEEKAALRDQGEHIYETVLTGDPEVFAEVWTDQGQYFPVREATAVLDDLAPDEAEVIGYRVEHFWSTTSRNGDREALASVVIEREDNSECGILISVTKEDGEYQLAGVPGVSE